MRIKKSEERWFDVPDDPDKAQIKIRELLPGEVTDIFDQVYVQNVEYSKGKDGEFKPVFKQNTDKKLDRELTMTQTVVDWKNFFELDGKTPLECNPENIMRASRTIEGFNTLVSELRDKLTKDIKKEQDEQLKNSPGSASK